MILIPESLPGRIGLTGNWANNCIIRADGDQDNASFQGSVIYIDDNSQIGINEISPETVVELTHASPYMTFHCPTESDAADSGMAKLLFKREQSGGEETTCAAIYAAHAGAADDQKGYIALCTNSGTDDDAPTERVRIDSLGNVGIGTAAPNAEFEVYGNQPIIRLIDDSNEWGQLQTDSSGNLKMSTNAGAIFLQTSGGQSMNFDAGTLFQFRDEDDSDAVRVVIDSSTGSVGIGETSPETVVELTHASPYMTFHCPTESDAADSGMAKLLFKREQSGGEETTCAAIYAAHAGAADDQKGYIALCTNSGTDDDAPTERVRIDSLGNVGIGTAAPDSFLEIEGNLAGGGIHLDSSSGAAIFFDRGGTINASYMQFQTAGADDWRIGLSNQADYNSDLSIIKGQSNIDVKVIVKVNGNVGIGTTAPTARLHLPASTVAAGTGPLKFTIGPLVTTPELSLLECNTSGLFFTTLGDRRSLIQGSQPIASSTTVANTTTETIIYTTVLAANELIVDETVTTEVFGVMSTHDASPTAIFRVKAAGTTITTVVTTAGFVTDATWRLKSTFTVRSVGATGTVQAFCAVEIVNENKSSANIATTTVDTTAISNVTVTVEWSAALADNSVTASQGYSIVIW